MINKMMVAISIAMTVAGASPLRGLAADQTKAAPAAATTGAGGHKTQFDDIKSVLKADQTKQFDQIMQEARQNNGPIYRKIAEGTFPPQIRISVNGSGWHVHGVHLDCISIRFSSSSYIVSTRPGALSRMAAEAQCRK